MNKDSCLTAEPDRRSLEKLYRRWNRPEYIHPDPLEFLSSYSRIRDREIAGLIAACLAYGNVKQILRAVSAVLKELGPHPARFLRSAEDRGLCERFHNFRHRFTGARELQILLLGVRKVIREYGSLEKCFADGVSAGRKAGTCDSILPAQAYFVKQVVGDSPFLLPSPLAKSACKRLNLFLRWMVRHDDVDPGGWESVNPALLIIPLDTHMARIGRSFGFTSRKNNDLATAVEVTNGFRLINQGDPVKYDFALTRFGIWRGKHPV